MCMLPATELNGVDASTRIEHKVKGFIRRQLVVYTGMMPFINLPSRHHHVWQTGGVWAMYSPSRSEVQPLTSYMDPFINYTLKKKHVSL